MMNSSTMSKSGKTAAATEASQGLAEHSEHGRYMGAGVGGAQQHSLTMIEG